jgi:radical SAM protein with 4Fe4S-binding SPASM domain
MTQDIIDKVLDELGDIKYKGHICLNWMNEPLEDIEHLLGMISKIRKKLPAAKIHFSTNGDFLTGKLCRELASAGLSELIVSLHLPNPRQWHPDAAERRFDSISKRMGLKMHIKTIEKHKSFFQVFLCYDKMVIRMFCLDYLKIGTTRAASVSTVSIENYIRKNLCLRPLTTFNISYDGTVYPCCDFYHGLLEHKKYIVGNVLEKSVFNLYADELIHIFIENSLKFGKKKMPCTSCRS